METIYFPSSLIQDQENQGIMKFDVFEWEVRGKQQQSKGQFSDPSNTKSNIASIILPISESGLSETFNVNWETGDTLNAKSLNDAVVKSAGNKVKELLGDPAKYLEYVKGTILNDFASQTYNGTEFREFSFTYKLLPRNVKEVQNIIKIINIFKKYSLSTWDKYTIKYPHFWNIGSLFPNFTDAKDFAGVKYKNCVCTSIEVNYFPDNIIAIFKSGHPISPQITLNFKELDRIYSNDIEI